MQDPQMLSPYRLDDATHVLPSLMPIPGAGLLPVNAALIRGPEPLLVDTGLASLRGPFLRCRAISARRPAGGRRDRLVRRCLGMDG